MAKTRKRRRVASNPRRRINRRRRNPIMRRRSTNRRRRRNPSTRTRIVVVAPKANRRRRRVNSHRRRVSHRRRRNPINTTLFGAPLFGRKSLELVGGGIVGVAASKFIPTLLPSSIGTLGSSGIGRIVVTGISAVVAGWAGSKVSAEFGQGVLFGGLMQTASVALNSFLPSVWTQLNPSLGDLMPGQFAVPQNPLRLPPPPPALPPAGAQARMNLNGLARAYGSAF